MFSLIQLDFLTQNPDVYDILVDPNQMHALKEALHVCMAPSSVVCREEEQKRVFAFCKGCIEQEKAGSLYVCGCPGTGKTLSIGKVKEQLVAWSKDVRESG